MLSDIISYCPNFILLVDNYFASYVRVIDIVIAGFLLWGGYKGFKKGFVLEVLSTVVFVIGILFIFYLITNLGQVAKGYLVETLKPTTFILYIIGFITVAVLINKMGQALRSKVNYSIFGDLDTFLGMAVGVMKYAIFLSIIIWLLTRVGYQLPADAVADSQLYPLLMKFQPWLISTGQKLAPVIGRIFNGISDLLQDRVSPE